MPTRPRSPARAAPPPAPPPAPLPAPPRPHLLVDPSRLPVALWAPNLLGYVRVLALVGALLCADRTSERALNCLALSFSLDLFDGMLARRLNMCSSFGDLLDHVTDHVTMAYLVWLTSASTANVALSFACNGATILYMLVHGRYFKHAAQPSAFQRTIEAGNFWNPLSVLWSANAIIIPLLKLSYNARFGIGATASTPLVDVLDALGALVGVAYTVSCLM